MKKVRHLVGLVGLAPSAARVMIGFALAGTLLIPVGVAQAAPAPAKPVSQPRQTTAVPAVGPSFTHPLYGAGAVPRVPALSNTHGCPYGDACMYTTEGLENNTPEHEYYYYGCYNLSNEYGTRWIYNNQYGGAVISGFDYYNCYGAVQWTGPHGGPWGPFDITPINSVRVNP